MEHLNISSSYKSYVSYAQLPVEKKDYMLIVKSFLKFIIKDFLDKGELILPERLGVLKVIGVKSKIKVEEGKITGLAPDWVKTKQLWLSDEASRIKKQLVYHFNENTNGIRYRVKWSVSRVLVKNKTLYDLKLTRANKRALSSLIKEGKEYQIK